DVATRKPIPLSPPTQLAGVPPRLLRSWGRTGAAVSLHDSRDGRVLAELVPVSAAAVDPAARPIKVGSRGVTTADGDEWFVTTPEGYFDCSANAARLIKWNVAGILYPAQRYLHRFRRPDIVQRALRGERITAPALASEDIPPGVTFVGLNDGESVPDD